MKRWLALVLLAALAIWQAPSHAQARVYSQAELDALLAPVALYPDPVLSQILVAATYPDDLRDAAAWSRANPQLTGEDAVRAAESMPWHPSVRALVAFPDLLARMDESPHWTGDLGTAFLEQEPYVMDTVQALRRRAQASGYLQSDPQQQVYQQGQDIAVYPAQPQMVYVPYYNPYVVYGPWWWPAYRPVFWQPWFARPAVFVSTNVFVTRVDWRHRHIRRDVTVVRPPQIRPPVHVHPRFQSAAPAPVVRPLTGQPVVRPLGEPVRIRPQPTAQTSRADLRRDFQRDHRVEAPAVTLQNRVQAVPRPAVGPVTQFIPQGLRTQPPALRANRSEPRGHFRPQGRQANGSRSRRG